MVVDSVSASLTRNDFFFCKNLLADDLIVPSFLHCPAYDKALSISGGGDGGVDSGGDCDGDGLSCCLALISSFAKIYSDDLTRRGCAPASMSLTRFVHKWNDDSVDSVD